MADAGFEDFTPSLGQGLEGESDEEIEMTAAEVLERLEEVRIKHKLITLLSFKVLCLMLIYYSQYEK